MHKSLWLHTEMGCWMYLGICVIKWLGSTAVGLGNWLPMLATPLHFVRLGRRLQHIHIKSRSKDTEVGERKGQIKERRRVNN